MSVEDFDRAVGGVAEFLESDIPEVCFYCGKPLAGLTAFWHGWSGVNIALHPACGVTFGARIIRDSLNAEFISQGKSPTTGIPWEILERGLKGR